MFKKSFIIVYLLISIVLSLNCTHFEKDSSINKKPKLKVFVLDGGIITVSDISLFSPGHNQGIKKILANPCFLIWHGKDTLLWDTGLPDEWVNYPAGVQQGHLHFKVNTSVKQQLKRLGLSFADINYLVLSHMHFDHIGNANLFTHSTVILQKEEYEAAFGENAKVYRYRPQYYEKLKNNKFLLLNGDYDVFGDGTVIIKRAVGHTPGHQTLFLNLAKKGHVLLSGDLYHFEENRIHKRVPQSNFDKTLTLKSMEEIEKFIAEKNATLWIQHDLEQNKMLPHFPHFIE